MKKNDLKKIQKWLKTQPSLGELCSEFPDEWFAVQQAISNAAQHQNLSEIINNIPTPTSKTGKLPIELEHHIRHRMLQLVIKNHGLSEVTGIKHGKISFNWFNGLIIQRLLFSYGLERKPASLLWFKLIWPLIWQKNYLMPLVEPKGIYCFYTKELINELIKIIGTQSCLEIAAGDGTLTRFLKGQDVNISATDNQSWQQSIEYPEFVINIDAKNALKKYNPDVVICSWPPSDNSFEKYVFKTRSVKTYIVIGSQIRSASGNWKSYKNQTVFNLEKNQSLSNLIVPPELSSAVYIFQRKTA
ncbi:hypothetical protein [Kiloniella majae]|uniref:hypothetical protein n=1 Tax=Kiloniella majae TaxID=1938558 RepID=UPI000A27771D|nr:hypothetical protein [Kiloniella majae]